MATKFLEPGGDATYDINFFTNEDDGCTIVSDIVCGSHVRSIRGVPGASNGLGMRGVASDTGGRISFNFYVAALPTSNCTFIGYCQNPWGNDVVKLKVYLDGTLYLVRDTGVQIGLNGTRLEVGKWYNICLCWTVTSTTINEFRVYTNGLLDISVTNATIGFTGGGELYIGQSSGDATADFRYNDIYVDDSSSLTYPGNILVTPKRPYSNGIANEFTTQIGSGNSGYGSGHADEVNERALSETNGWSISTTTKKTEEFNIESSVSGDINIQRANIIDYVGWIWASVDSILDSPVHNIILNGVATPKTLSVTNALYTVVAGSTIYPSGAGADIGIDAQYTTNAHLTNLFECGVLVAYIFPKKSFSTLNINGGTKLRPAPFRPGVAR